jgi:hypothetical protein
MMPIPRRKWRFQQSLDYIKEMDRAVIDGDVGKGKVFMLATDVTQRG